MEHPIELFNSLGDLNIERKPDLEFIHSFLGLRTHKSKVQVQVWYIRNEYAIVLLTDTGEGTSVTNAAETIIQEVYVKYLSGFMKHKCFFLETYSITEGIDLILPQWTGNGEYTVEGVDWVHVGKIVPKKSYSNRKKMGEISDHKNQDIYYSKCVNSK